MNPMLYPNWKAKVTFSAECPQPQVLTGGEKHIVIVAGLEPGQKIPRHPEGLALYHFLEGTGWVDVDGGV